MLAFCFYHAISPRTVPHLDLSIQLVAMVIVGGLGSVLGSFFGAALILFAPILLNNRPSARSLPASAFNLRRPARASSLMLYGGMIVGFLLIEPLGLVKIYDNITTISWSGHSGTRRVERQQPVEAERSPPALRRKV